MTSVSNILTTQVKMGTLQYDTVQQQAALALDALQNRLNGYRPHTGFLRRTHAPKGLYMWGSVGRGKSMLMDLFFENLNVAQKSRVHFHAFMQSVHKDLNMWRKLSPQERRAHPNYVRGADDDPIAPTAKGIAKNAYVLCFDEFQVSDIADAMILSRLFTALFERGVVVVSTSNRAPDDLYKDGLNRKRFLPFIELLRQNLEIFDFDGHTDHRLRKLERASVYHTPLGPDTKAAMDDIWLRLTRPIEPQIETLSVYGHKLEILCASDSARASFFELCQRPLGAADYLEIANRFSALVLDNIPKLGRENRNEAKRFVTLVDALYEAKTKLIISAEVPVQNLYEQGDGHFEFERTVSRLMEMQSVAYLKTEHVVQKAGDV